MDLIRRIIKEEINVLLNEADHVKQKKKHKGISDHEDVQHNKSRFNALDRAKFIMILHRLKSNPELKGRSETELRRLAVKEFKKEKYQDKLERTRKKKGGGTEKYDLKKYRKSEGTISAADSEQLRSMIDQENTDIAAVARKVFPNHTDEGAQSQLRKILNGERPMTKRVYNKLSRMVASGEIAIKSS